jgi:aryl-alcohol dehydrogenase-like predicted oxidoreductase
MTKIADLDVYGIGFGGNVFGWTIDEADSMTMLDAYRAVGGNFIDTADSYSVWVDGHEGGESEAIIGRWMAARGNRSEVVVATKVGQHPGFRRLDEKTIRVAIEASLKRLRTDYVDVFYAHEDDPETPLVETLGTLDALVREGKARHIAASNYTADRLDEALGIQQREGFARFVALQPHYSLADRRGYENGLAAVCERHGLACVPYRALEKGFLTGKYRPGRSVDSTHAARALAYLDDRGVALLERLDEIAAAHRATPGAVALAWILAQPTVAATLASARTPEHLHELLPAVTIQLTADELDTLDQATR